MKWLVVVDHPFVPRSASEPDICECGLPLTAPCHQPSLFEPRTDSEV
jgi:hypothetical protein